MVAAMAYEALKRLADSRRPVTSEAMHRLTRGEVPDDGQGWVVVLARTIDGSGTIAAPAGSLIVTETSALPPVPLMIETDRERITVVPKEPSDGR